MTMTTVDYSKPSVHMALLEMFRKFKSVSTDYCFSKGNKIPITLWKQWKEFQAELEQAAMYSKEVNKTWQYVNHCFRIEPETDIALCADAIQESGFDISEFALDLVDASVVRAAEIAKSLVDAHTLKFFDYQNWKYQEISGAIDVLCAAIVGLDDNGENSHSLWQSNEPSKGSVQIDLGVKEYQKSIKINPGMCFLKNSVQASPLLTSLFFPRAIKNIYESFMDRADNGFSNHPFMLVDNIRNWENLEKFDECLATFADQMPKEFMDRLNGRNINDLLADICAKDLEAMREKQAARKAAREAGNL